MLQASDFRPNDWVLWEALSSPRDMVRWVPGRQSNAASGQPRVIGRGSRSDLKTATVPISVAVTETCDRILNTFDWSDHRITHWVECDWNGADTNCLVFQKGSSQGCNIILYPMSVCLGCKIQLNRNTGNTKRQLFSQLCFSARTLSGLFGGPRKQVKQRKHLVTMWNFLRRCTKMSCEYMWIPLTGHLWCWPFSWSLWSRTSWHCTDMTYYIFYPMPCLFSGEGTTSYESNSHQSRQACTELHRNHFISFQPSWDHMTLTSTSAASAQPFKPLSHEVSSGEPLLPPSSGLCGTSSCTGTSLVYRDTTWNNYHWSLMVGDIHHPPMNRCPVEINFTDPVGLDFSALESTCWASSLAQTEPLLHSIRPCSLKWPHCLQRPRTNLLTSAWLTTQGHRQKMAGKRAIFDQWMSRIKASRTWSWSCEHRFSSSICSSKSSR